MSVPLMKDTKEAAEILGVSASRVRDLCARGEIPARLNGARYWEMEYMDIYRWGVKEGLIRDRFTVLEARVDELEGYVAHLKRVADVVGGVLLDLAKGTI
jgi:predicted site-specific integrase-resolvase